MHVLIIPSEEFVPQDSHLAGIFQKHQALALQKTQDVRWGFYPSGNHYPYRC